MDTAVALVQTYLHVNGYFTVTEYPVVAAGSNPRTVTDLDVLAYRLAPAETALPDGLAAEVAPGGHRARSGMPALGRALPDPSLRTPTSGPDMIIAEVKEGRARLNRALRDPAVLQVALARFGCCDPAEAFTLAQRLLRTGWVRTSAGHTIRVVAFGEAPHAPENVPENSPENRPERHTPGHLPERSGYDAGNQGAAPRTPGACLTVSMPHVLAFLQEHLEREWPQARHAQFKDPTLALLALVHKWEPHASGVRARGPDRHTAARPVEGAGAPSILDASSVLGAHAGLGRERRP